MKHTLKFELEVSTEQMVAIHKAYENNKMLSINSLINNIGEIEQTNENMEVVVEGQITGLSVIDK